MLYGALLAFQTRDVAIPALNDSKQIGLAIYTSAMIAVVIVPIDMFVLQDSQVATSFILTSFATFFAFTSMLLILFVPKVDRPITGCRRASG